MCVQLGIKNCFIFFHYAYRFMQYDLKVKGTVRYAAVNLSMLNFY